METLSGEQTAKNISYIYVYGDVVGYSPDLKGIYEQFKYCASCSITYYKLNSSMGLYLLNTIKGEKSTDIQDKLNELKINYVFDTINIENNI